MYSIILRIAILIIGLIILLLGVFLKDDKIIMSNLKDTSIEAITEFIKVQRFMYIASGLIFIIFGIGIAANNIPFRHSLYLFLILLITLRITDYLICKKYV